MQAINHIIAVTWLPAFSHNDKQVYASIYSKRLTITLGKPFGAIIIKNKLFTIHLLLGPAPLK